MSPYFSRFCGGIINKLEILVVEDDIANSELLKTILQKDGYLVRCAETIQGCFFALRVSIPDMIILDRGLPDGDGIQLCVTLRRNRLYQAIPILMLTGRASVLEQILGSRFGADDYLTKPFAIEEFRARVGAVVRKISSGAEAPVALCGIAMDFKARTVTLKNRSVELTNNEFELLSVFMKSPSTVFTRDSLIESVWRYTPPNNPIAVDVIIMQLRRKLGKAGSLIRTVRSLGFEFNSENRIAPLCPQMSGMRS